MTDVIKMEYENSGDIINSATPLYQKISKPYEYYSGISSDAIDYIGFHLLILLLICVAISAPAFSENYENGSDQILRCTKYGRTHLVLYKLISLFVVLSVFYFICTGIQISILNTAFGTESLKTSVQMLISVFSLASMNIGQLEAAVIMGGFLSILCSICFVSFLSSFIRTGMVTMLGAIILSLLPSILSGIVGIVWPVLAFPSSGIGLKNSLLYQFIDTSFVSFGHHGVWTPYAILFFTIIELPVFFLLSIRFYNRHQAAGG